MSGHNGPDGRGRAPGSRHAERKRTLGAGLGIAAGALLLASLLGACDGGRGQPADRSSAPPMSPSGGGSPGLIVFDGDSLTEGYMFAPAESYPSQVMRRLSVPLQWENVAVSGQTWPDLLRDVEREVDPLYSPERPLNVVVVWAGANDLAGGFAPREVYENARRYCEGRRREGFVVVILAMYPLQPKDLDDGYERRRLTYNALLREHWHEFADALVDVAADERIGDASPPARNVYFVDAVHLNETGYGVIADCVLRVLAPIVDAASAAGE